MSAQKRFVVEGKWSGYRCGQSRVVHRQVVRGHRAERIRSLQVIEYTDGTCLYVSVRDAMPREKVAEILGYVSLINQAADTGKSYVKVRELPN